MCVLKVLIVVTAQDHYSRFVRIWTFTLADRRESIVDEASSAACFDIR